LNFCKWEDLAGFSDWDRQSELDVSISDLQGLEEHINRYRESPVMHDAVPESYKPKLLAVDGTLRDFPAPRKSAPTLRKPWRARAGWLGRDMATDCRPNLRCDLSKGARLRVLR